MTNQEFINYVGNIATNIYSIYGILPSITIAQAIIESGWGASGLTREANNLFGIKGPGYVCWTKEFVNGKYIDVQAEFRRYDSWEESIIDHAVLLTNERYRPVRESTNYVEACRLLQECGYATSPTYAQTLIAIIKDYELYKWDEGKGTLKTIDICAVSHGDMINLMNMAKESELKVMYKLEIQPMSKGDLEKFEKYCKESSLTYTIK